MRRLGALPGPIRLLLLIAVMAGLLISALQLLPTGTHTLILVVGTVLGFAGVLVASVLVLPARVVARDITTGDLTPEQRASAINGVRSTLVQGVIGLAALVGIFVAWQQLQTDREQSRTDREQLREQLILTRQGQVADRFTRAVDQLGSDKLELRVGGIYALERIAKEATDGDARLVVAEVLSTYVRQHSPLDPTGSAAKRSAEDRLEARQPDVQAAVTVLARRTVLAKDPPLNLSNVDLGKADLAKAQLRTTNLRGSRLQEADLSGAQLQQADLRGVRLQQADLREAQLQEADLTGAQLQGAILARAQLQHAILGGPGPRQTEPDRPQWQAIGGNFAQLQGANLNGAQLQHALMFGVGLQGANLGGAQLQGAALWGAQLQDAQLAEAQLQGAVLKDARLQRSRLNGAQLQGANLNRAQLQGATANLRTKWPDGFDWRAAGVIRQFGP
jgi:uncharacterized protein YjbI with pentapeptide repeats